MFFICAIILWPFKLKVHWSICSFADFCLIMAKCLWTTGSNWPTFDLRAKYLFYLVFFEAILFSKAACAAMSIWSSIGSKVHVFRKLLSGSSHWLLNFLIVPISGAKKNLFLTFLRSPAAVGSPSACLLQSSTCIWSFFHASWFTINEEKYVQKHW